MLDNYIAVIPAAGVGKRMQSERPKQYCQLAGQTIIEHTLGGFLQHERCHTIFVALNQADEIFQNTSVASHSKVSTLIGGDERYLSVTRALEQATTLFSEDTWVMVHDSIRPFVTTPDLDLLWAQLQADPIGGLFALPSTDTIKKRVAGGEISTLNRDLIWAAATPQMFRLGMLLRCLQQAATDRCPVTDEAHAIELYASNRIKLIPGRKDNIKITTPEDLIYADFLFSKRLL